MPSSSSHLDAVDRFKQAFLTLPNTINRFVIAFSGGLDSHVLLHATQQLFPEKSILAVHVNHGLQAASIQFEQHCQAICKKLAIPLKIYTVNQTITHYQAVGYSAEEAARQARYKALNAVLSNQDCLLTAHHLNDQAETVLLQLMRGAGINGLGGMRLLNQYANTYHLRPLLSWDRNTCLDYAHLHQLHWIEDPTNQDQHIRRNFIRHTIIPAIQQQWPCVTHALARTARHTQEASDLCQEIAMQDLSQAKVTPSVLSVSILLSLSKARYRNALRYWLKHHLGKYPSAIHLTRIERLLHTTPNKGGTFCVQSVTIRRYRDRLYFLKKGASTEQYAPISWDINTPLVLPTGETLTATVAQGRGIQLNLLHNQMVEVRFRQGKERFQPQGQSSSSLLKKLFQQWAIPPWKRYQWPLIYHNNQLIAVPNHAVSAQSTASHPKAGILISVTDSEQ